MGRLFTYMVKAAAGQQPTPYTGSYGTWDGLYDMGAWETAGHRIRLGGGSSPAYKKYLSDRRRFIDEMYNASRSDNAQDWGKLQGAGDYLTAIDSDFKDAASTYDILSKNEKYREAIRHLANTGSWSKLKSLAHAGRSKGMRSPFAGDRSDYLLADGVGNAQLIMNMYLAEEARRKKADEAAQQPTTQQPAAPAAQPAPKPAAAPVQAPVPSNSSAVAAPVKKFGEHAWPMARNFVRQMRYVFRPDLKVHDTIQQNIDAGRSMYDGMTASTRGMTAGQRQALRAHGFAGTALQQGDAIRAARENAEKSGQPLVQSEHDAYTGSGLRMVGHSTDGKTRTYVGRSGRGRITVGDNAQAGHYRGVGAVDTNPRSNYANLRQPATTSPVAAPNVRKSTTAPRR